MRLLETPKFLVGTVLSEEQMAEYFDVKSSGSCVYAIAFVIEVNSSSFEKASGSDGSGLYLRTLGSG